ncbi:MAG: SDR family NAD(P)-dependent oxidoreductase [Rhodobacteraceae bacterium]|nr:SDR family NAD(P)-dependent oxidoreductase [Paracoccaceae bacterium]
MTDKIALVTGASRGFGAAVAEALAGAGYHVIAVARTVGALEELDDRIKAKGGSATLVPLDITDDVGLANLCRSVYERWGKVDLWLHSAIFACQLSPAAHVPVTDWDKSLAVNIRTTQRLITMVEPLLAAAGQARAVLPVETDVAGRKFMAAHGASKAAQQAIWDSWAAESTTRPLEILSFAPNPMPTALRARFYPGEKRDTLADPNTEAKRLMDFLAI